MESSLDFYDTNMKDIFSDEMTCHSLDNLDFNESENRSTSKDDFGQQMLDYFNPLFNYNNKNNCDRDSVKDANAYHEIHEAPASSKLSFCGESLAEMESQNLWSSLLDGAVLNDDPMMSDAGRSRPSDHCYSSTSYKTMSSLKQTRRIPENSQLTVTTKTYRDTKTADGSIHLQTIKQEPKIITVHTANPVMGDGKPSGRPAQSLLKGSSQSLVHTLKSGRDRMVYPITRIKREPGSPSEDEDVYVDHMPITPPSSNQSSDSEGAVSPPTSPVRQVLVARATGYRYNPATAMYSQPIPTSGVLRLTDEEKRTFITEGYPLPTKLPLSKVEEKNLKKVRRKIKNKISAQESRRKKKEYMDQLERKVDDIVRENSELKQKCDTYESSNRSLLKQLEKLQAVLKRISPRPVTAQTGTCLLVMVLCFAVFLGNWNPLNSSWPSYGEGPSISLDSPIADSLYDASYSARSSRVLTSLVESTQTHSEPWPIKLAKHSIRWSASLLFDANTSSVMQ
ncbi:cyclic AMP-responsive element-binding protein 3-like protein 1 [Watersipora subatra]|uniref:cyclic AMP-responsive element-binding protein 3-like protein 1 n=1 Tax=Watersipora subatra TaxID=2589382 RepID=UPI00355B7F5D